MNELLDLAIRFDEGELGDDEAIRFAALLLTTGLVNSTGTYGRFVNGLIEAGLANEIGVALGDLKAAAVLGVES